MKEKFITSSINTCANLSAIAFPIPLAKPITITTLPFMLISIIQEKNLLLRLTITEREIASLLGNGMTNQAIAKKKASASIG